MAPPARGSRPRHIPQRTCVACRQTSAKRQLMRVVRTPDGRVTVDPTGKLSGRGAYVCNDSPECWEAALKHRGALSRALKVEMIPEDDLLNALNAYAQRLSGTSEPVASSPRNE